MTPEKNFTYNELKAHYLAVRNRLGGLGNKSAGLVPMVAMSKVRHAPPKEEKKIVWDVVSLPKNQFWHILIEVAKKHNIDPNLLVASTRKIEIVRIRREVVWRAVKEQKYSVAQVGRWLKKDHTTILHDIHQWEHIHGRA